MTASSKLDPSASIVWHKTNPSIESTMLRGVNARQVALWLRLRHVFWLKQCKPLSDQDVARECRFMAAVDPADEVSEAHRQELLTDAFGFQLVPGGGWTIPDLKEQYEAATEAYQRRRENGAKGGKRSAEVRQRSTIPAVLSAATAGPEDDSTGDRGEGDF